jgi:hypothetical protein
MFSIAMRGWLAPAGQDQAMTLSSRAIRDILQYADCSIDARRV